MKVLLLCLMFACVSWAGVPKTFSGLTCNCGWRNAGRIVGGKETKKNEYPWMVSLSNGCGGSIISPWHILTAAHCTDHKTPDSIQVSVGRHKLTGRGLFDHVVVHRVANILQHEAYNLNNNNPFNDISILVLKTPIKFTQYVGPICLPKDRLDVVGKFIKVTGWGETKGTGDHKVLREVDVQVIHNDVCRRSWPLTSQPTQVCVYTPNKNPCFGDSGGPLIYLDPATNRFTQVAVVSYGPIQCGTDPRPSVNTDVFAFISWIRNAVARSHPEVQVCTRA